jgi:hypothetical protein
MFNTFLYRIINYLISADFMNISGGMDYSRVEVAADARRGS